jgi:hypothetical protein
MRVLCRSVAGTVLLMAGCVDEPVGPKTSTDPSRNVRAVVATAVPANATELGPPPGSRTCAWRP